MSYTGSVDAWSALWHPLQSVMWVLLLSCWADTSKEILLHFFSIALTWKFTYSFQRIRLICRKQTIIYLFRRYRLKSNDRHLVPTSSTDILAKQRSLHLTIWQNFHLWSIGIYPIVPMKPWEQFISWWNRYLLTPGEMNYTPYFTNPIDYISFPHNRNVENCPWFRHPPVSNVNFKKISLNK